MPKARLSTIVRFLSKERQMNAKRLLSVSLVLAVVVFGFATSPARAATTVVVYDFITYDNGMPQQLWATDYFHSSVSVEALGGNSYRLTFNDNGSTFVTLNAKSPGGNGSTYVAAGVKGVITGGEVVVVNGVLKNPLPSHIGTLDFRNDRTSYRYFRPFFDSISSVQYVWWKWVYSTCGNGTWTDEAATETLHGSVGPNPVMGDIKGSPDACQNPQGFDPADGRVEPRPGDRIALYCNVDPDKLVVYGIADDVPGPRNGFLLVVFSRKAISAAGDKGVTLSAGLNGTVSASLIKGWFWVAWNGGKYHATGQGDFKKNFEAKAWCPLPK